MSKLSLRKTSRRENKRRQDERRIIPHDFGSEKWLEMIKERYFLWPKEDLRVSLRRQVERREIERRDDDLGKAPLFKQLEDSVEQLTNEERQYIADILHS